MPAPCVPPRARHQVAGFTLVELLVVIGVITLLAALLLPVLGGASQAARVAKCISNLGQLYKATRQYAPYYKDQLPSLYNGVPAATLVERYRKSYLCRSDVGELKVPAGLWLLQAHGYAKDPGVYYCPNTPGKRQYNGTENLAVNGIPESVGYAYNGWPDTGLAAPPDLGAGELSNSFSQGRAQNFLALLGDRFEKSTELPHASRNSMNACYWDGSTQRVDLAQAQIPWNATEGEAKIFSADAAGSTATRDAWSLFSKKRR
jgi:prepilin-type N-terminal cleavage/methylation domain-containing protein